jgi:RNA polymerase sigma-70 factor, ECF subfamily
MFDLGGETRPLPRKGEGHEVPPVKKAGQIGDRLSMPNHGYSAADHSDFQLVQAARNEDKDAFGALIKKYHCRCVDLAASILNDRGYAEEEAQNAYWKAFARLHQFHGDSEFSSWLYRIVKNQCLMRIRSARGRRYVYLDDLGPDQDWRPFELHAIGSDPEGELGSREVALVLRREIARLPARWREVIVMRDVNGMTIADIASQLDVSVMAAKSRLSRARGELRERMKPHCGRTGAWTLMATSATQPQRVFNSWTSVGV